MFRWLLLAEVFAQQNPWCLLKASAGDDVFGLYTSYFKRILAREVFSGMLQDQTG